MGRISTKEAFTNFVCQYKIRAFIGAKLLLAVWFWSMKFCLV